MVNKCEERRVGDPSIEVIETDHGMSLRIVPIEPYSPIGVGSRDGIGISVSGSRERFESSRITEEYNATSSVLSSRGQALLVSSEIFAISNKGRKIFFISSDLRNCESFIQLVLKPYISV